MDKLSQKISILFADLEFRNDVENRLTTLQTDMAGLTVQVKGRWVVGCSNRGHWSASKVGNAFEEAESWKWIFGGVGMLAQEHLVPRVYHWMTPLLMGK